MQWLVVAAIYCVGCVDSNVVTCSDGRVCPAGSTCDDVHAGCASKAQTAQCSGKSDGDSCTYDTPDDGVCDATVCLPARCGDGYVRGTEECDIEDFGAMADCRDLGFYDSMPLQCHTNCTVDPTACTGFCGDGIVQQPMELCEAPSPPDLTCVDLGFGAGNMNCKQCGPDVSACKLFNWQVQYMDDLVFDIHGTSDSDIWIAEEGGATKVAHYDGQSWKPIDVSACGVTALEQLISLWTSGTDTFVASDDGNVFHISASGCTKSTVAQGVLLRNIWGTSATSVFATTDHGTYGWDGSTWTQLDATPSLAIWASSATDIYVTAGASPRNLRHYNGTWSTVPSGTLGLTDPGGIWGVSANEVYAMSPNGAIATWNGATWSSISAGLPSQLNFSTGATVGTTVFARNAVTAFAKVGNEWVDLVPPSYQNGSSPVWASPSGRLYVGDGNRINVFAGTVRSTEHLAPAIDGADDIAVLGANNAYATYLASTYVWDGTTWALDNDGSTTGTLSDIAVAGTSVVAVNGGGIWTHTAPGTWTHITGSPAGNLIAGSGVNDLWVRDANNMGTLHHWTGSAYTNFVLGTPSVTSLWVGAPNDAYATRYTDVGGSEIAHWNGAAWGPVLTTTKLYDAVTSIGGRVFATASFGNDFAQFATTWTESKTLPGAATKTLWGTAPTDVFAAGARLLHFDGARWSPVDTGDATLPTLGIAGTSSAVFFIDDAGVHRLIRTTAW